LQYKLKIDQNRFTYEQKFVLDTQHPSIIYTGCLFSSASITKQTL